MTYFEGLYRSMDFTKEAAERRSVHIRMKREDNVYGEPVKLGYEHSEDAEELPDDEGG